MATVKVHGAFQAKLSKEIIMQFFMPFGEIAQITLPKAKHQPALVEYAAPESAHQAIQQLMGTTLNDLKGKKKNRHHTHSEYVWSLSLQTEADLWEEDGNERVKIERAITEEKKRNLAYIEGIGTEIELPYNPRQRTPVETHTAAVHPTSPCPPAKNQ